MCKERHGKWERRKNRARRGQEREIKGGERRLQREKGEIDRKGERRITETGMGRKTLGRRKEGAGKGRVRRKGQRKEGEGQGKWREWIRGKQEGKQGEGN